MEQQNKEGSLNVSSNKNAKTEKAINCKAVYFGNSDGVFVPLFFPNYNVRQELSGTNSGDREYKYHRRYYS